MALSEADKLIQQAEGLFREHKLEEAVQYYNEAGLIYRENKQHLEAAKCFSQCAFCDKIRAGISPLLEAANWSEMAAREAVIAGDFALARWQFREAGLCYEREGDFEKYSSCFVESQDAYVGYLWQLFKTGKKYDRSRGVLPASWIERLIALWMTFMGLVSRSLWGYGEKPFNICFYAFSMISGCACLYYFSGHMFFHGVHVDPTILDAFYLSGVTFTTLGYGDFVPGGWARLVAMGESLSGFVMVPLLMIALTRRYLRLYR